MDNGVPVTEYADKIVGVYGGKFFPPHAGHLSFIEEAVKQVDVLFVVIQYDEEYEKQLCAGTPFPLVSPRIRERWLVEVFKDNPKVRVFSQYEHRSDYHLTDPQIQETYKDLIEQVGGHIDYIFSNTHEYDEYFSTWLPETTHIVMLENRDKINISASEIRAENVFNNWNHLLEPAKKYFTKRIAFCGWESAGKSYSSQHVAETFNTTYLPEYGRTFYVDDLGGFDGIDLPEDYIAIAAGHLHALNQATSNKILCLDTDLIYTQFFHWKQTNQLHPVIDALIKSNAEKIDTYFFLEPRNAFADDGTRFRVDEEERQRISDELKQMYDNYGKQLIVIDEINPETRLLKMETKISELYFK